MLFMIEVFSIILLKFSVPTHHFFLSFLPSFLSFRQARSQSHVCGIFVFCCISLLVIVASWGRGAGGRDRERDTHTGDLW